MKSRAAAAGLLVLISVACRSGRASADETTQSCHWVISYDRLLADSAGNPTALEWHLFDPSTLTDEVFLRPPSNLYHLQWDPNFTTAFYHSEDSLYAVPWRWGATPRALSALPPHDKGTDDLGAKELSLGGFWRDAGDSSWRMLVAHGTTVVIEDMIDATYKGELWETNPEGTSWRVMRRDSLVYDDQGRFQWPDHSSFGIRATMASAESLMRDCEVTITTKGVVPFDSAGCRPLDSRKASDWYFVPLHTPRRGVAFRRYLDSLHASVPMYLVDLEHHRWTALTDWPFGLGLFVEHCNLLLVLDEYCRPSVFDAVTGEPRLRGEPWSTGYAFWVRAPRY